MSLRAFRFQKSSKKEDASEEANEQEQEQNNGNGNGQVENGKELYGAETEASSQESEAFKPVVGRRRGLTSFFQQLSFDNMFVFLSQAKRARVLSDDSEAESVSSSPVKSAANGASASTAAAASGSTSSEDLPTEVAEARLDTIQRLFPTMVRIPLSVVHGSSFHHSLFNFCIVLFFSARIVWNSKTP